MNIQKHMKALKILERNVEAAHTFSTYEPGSDLVRDSYLEECQKTIQTLQGSRNTGEVRFRPIRVFQRHNLLAASIKLKPGCA